MVTVLTPEMSLWCLLKKKKKKEISSLTFFVFSFQDTKFGMPLTIAYFISLYSKGEVFLARSLVESYG